MHPLRPSLRLSICPCILLSCYNNGSDHLLRPRARTVKSYWPDCDHVPRLIHGTLGHNRSADVDESWNLQPLPKDHHAKRYFDRATWVVWANSQFATVRFLSCFISSSRAQVAPVDRFWQSIGLRHMTSFYGRMLILRVLLLYLPI